MRELAPDLTPMTPEVAVSGVRPAEFPAVVPRPGGRYLVFWHEGYPTPIQGRRFAAGGAPLGATFDANTFFEANLVGTRLAAGPNGDFLGVWYAGAFSAPEASPDGDVYAIMARFFGTALPIGDEFVVNSYTTEAQVAPAVAYGPDGRALVVWQSRGGLGDDTDGYSIQARFLESPAIFFDGFEEGSSAAWDVAVFGECRGPCLQPLL